MRYLLIFCPNRYFIIFCTGLLNKRWLYWILLDYYLWSYEWLLLGWKLFLGQFFWFWFLGLSERFLIINLWWFSLGFLFCWYLSDNLFFLLIFVLDATIRMNWFIAWSAQRISQNCLHFINFINILIFLNEDFLLFLGNNLNLWRNIRYNFCLDK